MSVTEHWIIESSATGREEAWVLKMGTLPIVRLQEQPRRQVRKRILPLGAPNEVIQRLNSPERRTYTCFNQHYKKIRRNQDMMMTGWRDGQIRSHDADTGQLLWSIANAHAHGVTSLVVSHNERFLVTGGMDGELRVWELRSRELVRTTRWFRGSRGCQVLFFCGVKSQPCARRLREFYSLAGKTSTSI